MSSGLYFVAWTWVLKWNAENKTPAPRRRCVFLFLVMRKASSVYYEPFFADILPNSAGQEGVGAGVVLLFCRTRDGGVGGRTIEVATT